MGFSGLLIKWYKKHKRDLPFRGSADPYRIWLSEIIMQQTRMEQGVPYYNRFIQLFPTIGHLAKAPLDQVMKTWQGLGYYSRARNLHEAARQVMTRWKGSFPDQYENILQLKGVGSYTAAAIASIAFDQPHAVLDGNVFRVLSRVYGLSVPIDTTTGRKKFAELAELLLDKKNPGVYNQALMEFGALQCVPANPRCQDCILKAECRAFKTGKVEQLPVKAKKAKVRRRYFNYLVIRQKPNRPFGKSRLLMYKRQEKDIWKGLYEFPLIESKKKQPIPGISHQKPLYSLKHLLSHQVIVIRFWRAEEKDLRKVPIKGNLIQVPENQLNRIAMARPTSLFLENFFGSKDH